MTTNNEQMKQNPIICVDFDGVIHSYTSGWKGANVIPDDPVPGAIDWLVAHLPLPDALGMSGPYIGPEPVIYSSRSSQRGGIKAMKEWFIKHGLSEWYIRDNILKFPKTKPAAFLTIDDRAICFDGRFPTTEQMMAFETWQRRGLGGRPFLGATGLYPEGKLNYQDEGELRLAISHDRDNVIIDFGKPVASLAMPPSQAIELANLIIKHARDIK